MLVQRPDVDCLELFFVGKVFFARTVANSGLILVTLMASLYIVRTSSLIECHESRTLDLATFLPVIFPQVFFLHMVCMHIPRSLLGAGAYGPCQSSNFLRLGLAPSNNCPLHFCVKYHFRVLDKCSFSVAHPSTLLEMLKESYADFFCLENAMKE